MCMMLGLPDEGAPLMYGKGAKLQLWVPLLEKAYAKAHGSYKAISGGWIAEGMFDLTGAPTESVHFSFPKFQSEDFFARLLSFHDNGRWRKRGIIIIMVVFFLSLL